MENANDTVAANVPMNNEIAKAVKVRGDYGGCADFLARKFGVAVDVFVGFFEGGKVRTVLIDDGLFLHGEV